MAERIINHRYILHELLGAGGMGTVYRATDRLTGQRVALKQVIAEPEQLQFTTKNTTIDFRLALSQEFKVLASVRHPNIISVLDYGFDEDRQPYFAMELLDEPLDITDAAQNQSMEIRYRLMVQLGQALAYLHRRGIIHRDLKPSNVVVVQAMVDGKPRLQVKVLDFGLAQEYRVDGNSPSTVGTLPYMSPEVLSGAMVTAASDVYSMGVMTYELYSGHHPYDLTDVSQLVNDIFQRIPDVQALDITEASKAVVARCLAKNPDDRYANAQELLHSYAELTGQSLETHATRESYLQAARLVGRDAELSQMNGALDKMLGGEGGIWLIGGESGVGKSRLLDEVATLSLVRGALVLRGQAVSDGGALYAPWRPVVRHLCLFDTLSDADAHILKMLVPDIAELSGRSLPDTAVTPNPQLARELLLRAITTLFEQQTRPIVVMLEDLHWANESVDVIVQLQAITANHPLLIIGAYRDDERPDLPKSISGAQILKLQRLDKSAIADLSEAILGETGKMSHVVDFLADQTEGNVFFIVEVVRALAEEAGQLTRIGASTLPTQVFAGGVDRIVRRRLTRVPEQARTLLTSAAVLGRQLDLRVLEMLNEGHDLTPWLTTCEAAAVIEVQDGKWCFAHDKLREAALSDLSAETRRDLHRQIAQSLERAYGERADYLPALAYHWKQADDPAKILHFAVLAGDQAIQSGANRTARGNFIDALDALNHLPASEESQRQQVDLTIKMVRASAFVADELVYERLRQATEIAEQLGDAVRQVRVLASKGAYEYTVGKVRESLECFSICIPHGEALEGIGDALMTPYIMLGRTLLFFGDYKRSEDALAKGIKLAEQFNDDELLSGALAVYACVLWDQGRVAEGLVPAERSMKMAEALGNPTRKAANLVWLTAGALDGAEFELGKKYGAQLLDVSLKANDRMSVFVGYGLNGMIAMQEGRYAEAEKLMDSSIDLAQRTNIMLALPQYLALRSVVYAELGQLERAKEQITAAIELMEKTHQTIYHAEIHGYAARIHRLTGEYELAAQHIEQGEQRMSLVKHKLILSEQKILLLLAREEHEAARKALEEHIAECERHNLTWEANRMKALRESLAIQK